MKKFLVVTAMAVMAMVLSIPASASAARFVQEGQPIPAEGESETFTGQMEFDPGGGGFSCAQTTIDLDMTTNAATIGGYSAEECETVGGMASTGCVFSKAPTPEKLPWGVSIDPSGSSFNMTGIKIYAPFEPGCSLGGTPINSFNASGTITATPDNPALIASIGLSGIITTNFGKMYVNGTLTAANPGKYEIEP